MRDVSVENLIQTIRGRRVILDDVLAALYGVTTARLNTLVTRNADRFPDEFSFVLTEQEFTILRSQIATSSWRHRGKLPRVFTAQGLVMVANVLKSSLAVQMSVGGVREFVRLREMIAANPELAKRLEAVERRLGEHDDSIRALVTAVRRLMAPPERERKRIGFRKEP